MIATITLNPSIDYTYLLPSLSVGKTNRVENPHISIGGKGINAGRVISILGEEVLLTGVLGGTSGEIILDALSKENKYTNEFLFIDGNSRNTVTIMHDDAVHTELTERGLYISETDENRWFEKLSYLIKQYPIELLCISGSVNSTDNFFYCKILNFLRNQLGDAFPILLDISGVQLKNVLQVPTLKPTFIKPNIHELEELLNQELDSLHDILSVLRNNLFNSVETVMISRGSDGAIVKHQSAIYLVEIPRLQVISTTGSGDATVGGMAYAMKNNFSIEDAIKYSMACGMSNALFENNGIVDKKHITQFFDDITITNISK